MRNNNKIITIEDAKLQTMQVEIQALIVNGKQMTLSVFRQIPQKNIIADDGKLLGVPWGLVNYFWKDNAAAIHVLWQDGKTLYRALENLPRDLGYHLRRLQAEKLKVEGNIKRYETQEYYRDDLEKSKIALGNIIRDLEETENFINIVAPAQSVTFNTLSNLPQLYIAL